MAEVEPARRFNGRLDMIANVGTIVTCALVCSLVLYRFIGAPRQSVEHLAVGSPAPAVSGLNYGVTERTLLLGTRAGCRYCTDSVPVFKEVTRALAPLVEAGRLQIYIVSPDPEAMFAGYLETHGMAAMSRAAVEAASPLARATPAVVIADRDGRIRASWLGLVDSSRGAEILATLK